MYAVDALPPIYTSFFILISRIIMGSAFSYNYRGITNLTLYPIPKGTSSVSFYSNSISEIPDGYFTGVPTIKIIYLHKNKLSVIKKHMFAGLIRLGRLQLHTNQISTIEPGSFKDNCALYQLELQSNLIQSLPESIFAPENHPTNLDAFYLQNNPLSCDKSLCWLMRADGDWISVSSFTDCDGPGALNGRKWNTLTALDLNCDPPGETHNL